MSTSGGCSNSSYPRKTRCSSERLAEALRDMRLLGLQPTLLAPLDLSILPRSERFASSAISGSNGAGS